MRVIYPVIIYLLKSNGKKSSAKCRKEKSQMTKSQKGIKVPNVRNAN